MAPWFQLIATAVAVVSLVGIIIAPLYSIVLDLKQEIGANNESQTTISDDLAAMSEDLREMRIEVRRLSARLDEVDERSQMNQQHIHDMLARALAGSDGNPDEIAGSDGNPDDGDLVGDGGCAAGGECPFYQHRRSSPTR